MTPKHLRENLRDEVNEQFNAYGHSTGRGYIQRSPVHSGSRNPPLDRGSCDFDLLPIPSILKRSIITDKKSSDASRITA